MLDDAWAFKPGPPDARELVLLRRAKPEDGVMGFLHILATLICGAPAALGAAQGLRGSEVREGVRILITSNASTPSDPEPPPVSAATISGLPSIKWGDLEPRDGEMPACAVQRQWQESGLFCTASAAYLACE
jgi:hypothetical protein